MNMKHRFGGFVGGRACSAVLLIMIFLMAALSIGAGADQNKKKKKSDDANATGQSAATPATGQIERDIGEMLVAFQLGDVDGMHKYYSDEATFVRSGSYDPPIVGWANYAQEYKVSAAAFHGMQIIRRNTLIFTHPDVAWATYQWEFNSTVDGKPFGAKGQTTLVFNKVGDNWVIVHNHTSQICPPVPAPAQAPAGTKAQGP
jgi:ketosteroid isomerase-like protein